METRTAKLLPHLRYPPEHTIYVPAFILFDYYFAVMKLYAPFTHHETAWGTRAATAVATTVNDVEKTSALVGYARIPASLFVLGGADEFDNLYRLRRYGHN